MRLWRNYLYNEKLLTQNNNYMINVIFLSKIFKHWDFLQSKVCEVKSLLSMYIHTIFGSKELLHYSYIYFRLKMMKFFVKII